MASNIKNLIDSLFNPFSPKPDHRYNCARVYTGWYITGTNENGQMITHGYKIINGEVAIKKLNPVYVNNDEGDSRISKLETEILTPKTETATIEIQGTKTTKLTLYKTDDSESLMYKDKILDYRGDLKKLSY